MKGLGMCIWSWPVTPELIDAYRVCQFATSGTGIQMPYPALPFDEQPNLFFEYLTIFNKTRADYMDRKRGQNN
jgi:hypothetical protein